MRSLDGIACGRAAARRAGRVPSVSVDIAEGVDDALAMIAAHPETDVLAGGTDLLVEINFGRRRPAHIVAIDRLADLRYIERNGRVRMGALVTYTAMLDEDCGSAALREAARTIGSPQIRNTATIGGNLGTASPAGDTLPVLAALDATVRLRSVSGERTVLFADFMTGRAHRLRRVGRRRPRADVHVRGDAQRDGDLDRGPRARRGPAPSSGRHRPRLVRADDHPRI
jgi:CO/xanthine dehydrogenase FAD-binding subunit